MESFSELIKARRSMRKFTEEELTQEQVVTLMKAALMAPTSKRSNAWQFIVVDEKKNIEDTCQSLQVQLLPEIHPFPVQLQVLR